LGCPRECLEMEGGTGRVGLAGEGNQALEAAVGTADSREAPGEDAAVEVGAKLSFDEGGEAVAMGAPLADGDEERFQPLPDDLVEEGLLGFAPVVLAERSAGRAAVALPGLGELWPTRHARALRKRCARGPQGARIPMSEADDERR
jgi:hypothetical protein